MDFTGITVGGVDVGTIATAVLAGIGGFITLGAMVAHFTATDKDDKFFAKAQELLDKVKGLFSKKEEK